MLHILRSSHCPRNCLQVELAGVRGHCSWVSSGNVRSSRVRRFANGDVSSPDDPPGTLLRFLFCICAKFKASFHRWVILLLSTFIQSILRIGIFAGKFRSFDSSWAQLSIWLWLSFSTSRENNNFTTDFSCGLDWNFSFSVKSKALQL